MLRRIEGVVVDLTHGAAVAKEVSVGLYQAFAFLVRGESELDRAFARHDAAIQKELVGV
jgi:hypothetical protein